MLAIALLILSLVPDVLFSDELILFLVTMLSFRTFGVGVGGLGQEQVEGMLEPAAGTTSAEVLRHLYGVFHSRI